MSNLRGHGRSEWGDPADWSFETCADDVRVFCDTLGIAAPIVYGHPLGGFVAMARAARHVGHPGALVLQSTCGRFDVTRVVEGFRRAGGDEVAEIAARFYGGDRESVSVEEWERCRVLFGRWVPGDDERAQIIQNADLNVPGLELMREVDVLDQLSRIECPTLVCVGACDPVMPLTAARELVESVPDELATLAVIQGAGTSPGRMRRTRTGPLSPNS